MTTFRTATNAPAARFCFTGLVFVVLYTLCNHLTGTRPDVGRGVFDWERSIPFVAWTIIPYLSIFVFFALSFFIGRSKVQLDRYILQLLLDLLISLCCYLLFPLRFMFQRPELDGAFGMLFDLLGTCDLPYNRAPSLHISVLLLLWLRLTPFVTGWARLALQVWFSLIGLSVLTTYQHHLIDIPAGLIVGSLCVGLTSERARTVLAQLRAPAQGGHRPLPTQ